MTTLQAKSQAENDSKTPKAPAAAALLLGFSLMTATAIMPLPSYAETALDFSLPKYDTSMTGFGEGNEARLYDKREMTDPGANEREKQQESMRKAEEARKERIAREKAAQKLRDEEARAKALEKKARDAERLKNIWAS